MKKNLNLIIKNLKYFSPLVLKNNPIVLIMMIFRSLFGSINNLTTILFSKYLIKELFGLQRIDIIIFYILLFLILQCLINILYVIFDYYVTFKLLKLDYKLAESLNKKVTEVDYFNIENSNFLDELNHARKCINNYTNGVYGFYNYIFSFFEGLITLISVSIIFIEYNVLYFIPILIINVIINMKLNESDIKLTNNFYDVTNHESRVQNYYNQGIYHIRFQKVLRLFFVEKLIKDKQDEINNKLLDKYVKMYSKRTNNTFLYYLTDKITYALIIALLIICYYNGGIEIAAIAVLFTACTTFADSSSNSMFAIQSYFKDCVFLEHYIDFMNIESIFVNGNQNIDSIDSIEFKNVSFKYPNTNNYILKNVSFKINNKEKVSIVGINGSGKTTIIKLLARFYDVEEGEILINDKNIKDYEYKEYVKLLSIVFQDYKIVSYSIKENIEGLNDNNTKLYEVLDKAQILDKVNELENREYTMVNKWFDKSGVAFSGGEMQKFAIARALYKGGDLIILDEPTSSLDPISEAKIYEDLNRIIGEKMIIFISHRLSSCIFCDKIIVLDGSKIVDIGTHDELMKRDGVYKKMFLSQAEYYKK